MFVCACGRRFAGTLAGAWDAKLHAEAEGHRIEGPSAPGAASSPAPA